MPDPTDQLDLTGIATDLYGLPLDEFTAARDARAKELRADGERAAATAVKALRRPSAAAWAVNQLVRARPDEVEQLLALGASLREAQASFTGDELRELGRQQHRVVAAVRREAQAVAREKGQRLSDTVAREVEATLKAGMADVDAAAAVRSGILLRALANTGFTSVDLDGAVALPEMLPAHGGRPRLRVVRDEDDESESPADERAAKRRSEEERAAGERQRREEEHREREERERLVAQARAAGAEAEARRAESESALDEARTAVNDLGARRAEIRERLARLRRELEEAEAEDDDVSARLSEARSARDAADTELRRTTRAEDKARAHLEDLADR